MKKIFLFLVIMSTLIGKESLKNDFGDYHKIPIEEEGYEFSYFSFFCSKCKTFTKTREHFSNQNGCHGLDFHCKCSKNWKKIKKVGFPKNWRALNNNSPIEASYEVFGSDFWSAREILVEEFENAYAYSLENKDCNCYWYDTSKLAYKIYQNIRNVTEHLSYSYEIPKAIENLFFRDINEGMNLYGLTTPSLLHMLYINCYWYSQYNNVNDSLGKWISVHTNVISEEDQEECCYHLRKAITSSQETYLKLYSNCLNKHPHPKIYYERGLVYFHMGEYGESLHDMKMFFKSCPEEKRTSTMYLQEGSSFNECGKYYEAIKSLTKAIQLDPENLEAYFLRAYAYFETGEFERSLEDYIVSDKEYNITPDDSDFASALAKGLARGSWDSGKEFLPILWNSVCGVTHGLWALAKDPIETSTEFSWAAKQCFLLILQNTALENLELVVPEIADLYKNWHNFTGSQRGEALGYIVGKYGVDILISRGTARAVACGKSLKMSNFNLTLSAMKKSPANKKVIKKRGREFRRQRKLVRKNANLTVQADKQGKHIVGHHNYIPDLRKSIFEHKKPKKLVRKYAGTGMKEGPVQPGKPGYKEVVNFKEHIGYAVDKDTGKRIQTTWGKIHYAKDGVHIVPIKPR